MDPRFFLPCFHGPRASRLDHKRKEKKLGPQLAVRTSHSANKMYTLKNEIVNADGQSEVSILGPLNYRPSTLPLRHSVFIVLD